MKPFIHDSVSYTKNDFIVFKNDYSFNPSQKVGNGNYFEFSHTWSFIEQKTLKRQQGEKVNVRAVLYKYNYIFRLLPLRFKI